MKYLKWVLFIVAILFLFFCLIGSPWAFIGVLVFLAGLFLRSLYKKGNIRFAKSGWIITLGLVLAFVLALVNAKPVPTSQDTAEKTKVVSIATEKKEQEKEKEIKKEKAALAAKARAEKIEQEEKAKKQREQKKLAEEKAAAEKKKAAEAVAAKKKEEQQEQAASAKKFNLEKATVSRVVDGDTIETSDGKKIRLIGVNTPESTTRHEEYGKEASNYTSSALTGKTVWLQKDVSETDRYNRYLRIVWLSIPSDDRSESEIRKKMFNAHLVLNGYAEPSTYQPDVKYSDTFIKFAREARNGDKGLWAFGSEGTTKGDLDAKPVAKAAPKPAPKPAPAPATTPEPAQSSESFQNCTEMRKVYPNGVPSTHPAYESRHDRDKDNWACER